MQISLPSLEVAGTRLHSCIVRGDVRCLHKELALQCTSWLVLSHETRFRLLSSCVFIIFFPLSCALRERGFDEGLYPIG